MLVGRQEEVVESLINSKLLMQESEKNGVLEIAIPINSSWKEWIKTVARYDFLDNNRVRLFVNENAYILRLYYI